MPQPRKNVSTLDPRDPLVLDTRTLARRPGQLRSIERVAPAPAGLGLDVVSVPIGSDVALDLRLESVVEGVLVSGSCHAQATGECVRCLDPVTFALDLSIQELFAYPDAAAAAAEDIERLDDDLIDLSPLLHDAVVLELPLQPLCREDCPGLCARCGARLADDTEHHHDEIDPRWAALVDLND
ncbi:MAG: YceD family protein [Candidatus Nanopelagicales bacterium]